MKLQTRTDREKWSILWKNQSFKNKVWVTSALLVVTAFAAPFFFQKIEDRNGVILNDVVLKHLPAYNLSILIFALIWLMFFISIIRAIQSPVFFITFIIGYLLLNLSRFITILLVPLDPPQGIIELADPLTSIFYGNQFVTKDLFYSGHVSTLLLMSFCYQKKFDRILGYLSSVIVAVSLLIQHVHYTIDVIAAPVFGWLIYLLAKKIALNNQNASPN